MKKLLSCILLFLNIFIFSLPISGHAYSSYNPSSEVYSRSNTTQSFCKGVIKGLAIIVCFGSCVYLYSGLLTDALSHFGDCEW